MSDDDFLSRWSRRKTAARAGIADPAAAAPAKPAPGVGKPGAGVQSPPTQAEDKPAQPLPPIESLTPESDFSAFMKPDVDPALRRQALKVLLRDPRFNVMDGLDVYIDDYTKPDPMPAEWLEQLNQIKRLGHYVEPAEDAPDGVESQSPDEAGPLRKPIPEQPVEAAPPDTADAGEAERELGKSAESGTSIR